MGRTNRRRIPFNLGLFGAWEIYRYATIALERMRLIPRRSFELHLRAMNVLIAALALVLLPTSLLATAQVPENIVFEGKKELMASTPLEDLFTEERPKPKDWYATSSANWRGYIGSWEIRDGQLFLVKVERAFLRGRRGEEPVEIKEDHLLSVLFPEAPGPVFAEWFSGVLRIPRGEELMYVHMGFGSVFEEDVFINVVKGRVIGIQKVTNRLEDITSDVDLQARELGRLTDTGGVRTRTADHAAKEEAGEWMDASTLLRADLEELISSKKRIIVRGIFSGKGLWMPVDSQLALDCSELKELPLAGSSAELEGTLSWRESDSVLLLHVTKAKTLAGGSAIQRPRRSP